MNKIVKHFGVVVNSWLYVIKYFFSRKNQSCIKKLYNGVSLVITSCNRPTLLNKTLKSFKLHNTHRIDQIIFIEDGGCVECIEIFQKHFIDYPNVKILINEHNNGQLKSIDKAYSFVKHEYIFHLEDDWIFTRKGFIEFSKNILENNKKSIYVSLRSKNDQNNHPFKKLNGVFYTPVPFWNGCWVGFGFNPSLRRSVDYFEYGLPFSKGNKREIGIGLVYYIKGFKVYLIDKNEDAFIKHEGGAASTYEAYKKA